MTSPRRDLLLQAYHYARLARRHRLDGYRLTARDYLGWAARCRELALLH